jgi:phosphoribosylformylglycinamidine cyclo-ligase
VSRLLDVSPGGLTYAQAGVDIAAGDEAVEHIKQSVRSTNRPGVLGGIGGFGGLFQLDLNRYKQPVLVASTDGVGTKLEIARQMNRYDTIGLDLVAMLVDDLACVGAEPLFLLDYVAVGKLDPSKLEEIVAGIAEGCRMTNTALLGGETAEHGGVLRHDDVDVAGFVVGVIEKGHELGAERVKAGDVIIGFSSPGLRSNGYSLARRVLVEKEERLFEPAFEGSERVLGEELLLPSVIYTPAILAVQHALRDALHAVAHITGGGIVGNVPRALPKNLDAHIEMASFLTPEIFFEIQRRGNVSADEMVRVFNCGLGMTVFLEKDAASEALDIASKAGIVATVVGEVREGSGTVMLW